jgi:predicted RNase H-like HicB family nuclease
MTVARLNLMARPRSADDITGGPKLFWPKDARRSSRFAMPHYVAIVEEDGPEKAVGIWFPDLPGCFSAGDDLDEALRNAPEAIGLYAESLADEGRSLPSPRSPSALRHDPEVMEDIRNYMVALVAAPNNADAAE